MIDKDYSKVKAFAQAQADAYGTDHGLERTLLGEWSAFMLPRKQSRRGHELRCEVVMPSQLSSCRQGHGP